MSRKPFRRATDVERRGDLIAAMLDCIAEGGIQNATVREVAEKAGVSGGLIRHYFVSKDQLLQAAYRKTMDEMTGISADAVVDETKTPRQRLLLLVIVCLTPPMIDSRRLSLWAAFIAVARINPEMAAIHREGYLEFRLLVERLLAAVFVAESRPADAVEVRRQAIAINALLDGLWLEGCLASDLFEKDELLETGIQSVEAITGLQLKD